MNLLSLNFMCDEGLLTIPAWLQPGDLVLQQNTIKLHYSMDNHRAFAYGHQGGFWNSPVV